MDRRAVAALFAIFILALAGCGGSSSTSSTPTTTPAATRSAVSATSAPATQIAATVPVGAPSAVAQTPAPTVNIADAALAQTCRLLTAGELAPLGQVVGPAALGKPPTTGDIQTSFCHYNLSDTKVIEARIYVFSPQYTGPKDFAKQAVTSAADAANTTVTEVAGVGDYAGVEVPPAAGSTDAVYFYAQKGSLAVRVGYQGSATDAYPTVDQLTQLGKAAAAKLF